MMTSQEAATDAHIYRFRPELPGYSPWVTRDRIAPLMVGFEVTLFVVLVVAMIALPPEDEGEGVTGEPVWPWVLLVAAPVAVVMLMIAARILVITWKRWLLRRFLRMQFELVRTDEGMAVSLLKKSTPQQYVWKAPIVATFVPRSHLHPSKPRIRQVRLKGVNWLDATDRPVIHSEIKLRDYHIGTDHHHDAFAAWLVSQGVVTCCLLPPRPVKPALPFPFKFNRETFLVFAFVCLMWCWALVRLLLW